MSKPMNAGRTLYRVAGYVAVAASLVFIGLQAWEYSDVLVRSLSSSNSLLWVLWASMAYAASLLLLVVGFYLLYRQLSGAGFLRDVFILYSRTFIAKYLPGNVGHFLGRQLFAKRFEMTQTGVGFASLLEVVCQVVAALVLCIWVDMPSAPPLAPELCLLMACCALFIAPFVLLWVGNKKGMNLVRGSRTVMLANITFVVVLDALFLFTAGGMVYLFFLQTQPYQEYALMMFVSAYAVAWFLGFVTPGAPAGVGVREAAIVSMLSEPVGPQNALVVAILFRMVTTVGDILFFLSSYTFALRPAPEKSIIRKEME